MKTVYVWIVALTVFANVVAGCQSEVIDLSAPVDPPGAVSYSNDVQPIFTTSCGDGACHINVTTNGVNLTTHRQVLNSVGLRYGRAIVEPGDAAASPIIDKLGARPQFGARMPNGRPALSAEQIGILRTWINEGAQNN